MLMSTEPSESCNLLLVEGLASIWMTANCSVMVAGSWCGYGDFLRQQ